MLYILLKHFHKYQVF